jgi:hypothetical protein
MKLEFAIALCAAVFVLDPGAMAQKGAALPTLAEINVLDEIIPPGGTAQLKFILTEPRPIMTGTQGFALDGNVFDDVFGIAVFSPAGDAFGVAKYEKNQLSVQYLSPLGSYSAILDYPILTVATHVRSTAVPGMQTSVQMGPGFSWTDILGQTFPFVQLKPGILTVGGTVAVHNVVPGGGTWDAGTVIKVLGMGFRPDTKVRTKFVTSSVKVVSDTEIDMVLAGQTVMDAQKFVVVNPKSTSDTYYSYLRGVDAGQSGYPVIASAVPVFPLATLRRVTVFQSGPGVTGTGVTALSIQNSNPAPATVVVTASTPLGQIGQVTLTLAFGQKIVRELGEYFGRQLPAGAKVQVAASEALQFVPFLADTATGKLTPFAPIPQ